MSDNVTLTIDGQSVTVPAGVSVWAAARKLGIRIPTLCHHPDLRPYGGCRACVVEVEKARTLAASCVFPVGEGMVVHTNTPKVRAARKLVVELLLANHPKDCLHCPRNLDCEMQTLAQDVGVKEVRFTGAKLDWPKDYSNPALVRDPNKCVLCGRCVRACSDRQAVNVYTFANRGFNSTVSPAFGLGLGEAKCAFCGQCAAVCPTGAITVMDETEKVMAALADPDKTVVAQVAPAARVALGEMFGLGPGEATAGQVVGALKLAGFHRVLDGAFAAGLAAAGEAQELSRRLAEGRDLPMLTSCSPGFVNFVEMHYPALASHLSKAKSPWQAFGAWAKGGYAQKEGLDPAKVVTVSIGPCTAAKFEAQRPEGRANGRQDVDFALTTRELAHLLKARGIMLRDVPEKPFDQPQAEGAAGAMVLGDPNGLTTIRETEIDLGGRKVRAAVATGLANARQVLGSIQSGNPGGWQVIKVMACPGGCVFGGGQPAPRDQDARAKRLAALKA